MLTSGDGFIHVRVGHGLLIRQSECQVTTLTDLIRPVGPTDVQSCWLFVCRTLSLDGCDPMYVMVSGRAHSLAVGSAVPWRGFCSFGTRSVANWNTARD